jgi:hypothetical protein
MLFLTAVGCDNGAARRELIEKGQSQVRRIASELDGKTTVTGVYVRVEKDEIKESDPWGTQVQVVYSQGGVAETVSVRSAGPDREFHTDDDLVASGISANFKGIGEGIKQNAKETATEAAKGLVKGTVEGVKESVKGVLPFGKKDGENSNSEASEVQGE